MSVQAADFVGTWRLREYSFVYDDDTVAHPWGMAVRGYLIYSAEGYMSANLGPARDWPSRRERLATAFKERGGAEALRLARRAGRRDYIAYTGGYTVEGDTVVHHVEVSLFPNWVGRPEARCYKFEDDVLTLRTGPLKEMRRTFVAQLLWDRVKVSAGVAVPADAVSTVSE